jgi:hypothetical protein
MEGYDHEAAELVLRERFGLLLLKEVTVLRR